MTRHVSFLFQSVTDNEDESKTGSLAKRIFEKLNGKTVLSVTLSKYGRCALVLLVYEDA